MTEDKRQFKLEISIDIFQTEELGFGNSAEASARAEEIMRNGIWIEDNILRYPWLCSPARIRCIELVEVITAPNGHVTEVR